MKNRKWLYAAGVLALSLVAHATTVSLNTTLVNEPALAYNNQYPIDLQANGVTSLSAQVTYGSATIANVPFVDGSQSTGSFTVGSFSALKAASATNQITVTSTSNLTNAAIILPGFVFSNGIDWATQSTASGTAVSIKLALQKVPYLSVSSVGSVVYATATAGAYYNATQMVSSNGNIVVATPYFTGGQDNATLQINGVQLRQGTAWTAATSNAATASSIASAINAAPFLNTKLHAQAIGSVVTATSTLNGAVYNYKLQSSAPSALTASGPLMVGGDNAAFTLGSSVFNTTGGSTLSKALPVLYSGSPTIGGLSNGTTYYAVPVSGNSFMLAKFSTSAVAGNVDLVVVTSTNTQIHSSEHTYTLAPLPITGTPSFKWQVSNDSVNWSDLQVSSVTVSSYSNPPALAIWSFGFIGTRYVRLNVVAPTTGGLAINAQLFGTN